MTTDAEAIRCALELHYSDLFDVRVNADAVRSIREWCDKTEAAAHAEQLLWKDSEAVFQARMELVDEVRALLPEVAS